jgi:leucyl aminopeptidase (aminopeptidase T)
MSWPEKLAITRGAVDMLRVNMGLKTGETLVVATDVPRTGEWQTASPDRLADMLERAMLARLVADVAVERFPQFSVVFLPFPSVGGHGTEADAEAVAQMQKADVLLALTTYSLTHTNAREAVTKAGGRVASMPGFDARMLEPDGPMAADYQRIATDCRAWADLLTRATEVQVRTPNGTDLRFSLEGRPGQVDDGSYDGTGADTWGNLPAGETYAIPLEGTGEGQLVVGAGWYPNLDQDMVLRIQKGEVIELQGGGTVGDRFRELLRFGSDTPVHKTRRNLAELGIGTNPNARKPESVLEAEKIKGTVHIGIGDNIHMGGRVEADLHDDFVQPHADLILDGKPVIVGGEWRIQRGSDEPPKE